jgi:drug/metabolite transporter (DMT)-like permease
MMREGTFTQEDKGYLDLNAIITIIIVTLVWGFNHTAIKYSTQGVSPIFASALRSVIASICGIIYCLRKGERIFHTDIMLFHGFMVGLLFGVEFACILAFSGILIVFHGRPETAKPTMFIGDILEITAAFLWGATTIYIKRFMAEKVHPINTFLYQLFFSIPILFLVSFILEPRWIYGVTIYIVASIFYQSVIVAFISYFVWFKLIHNYSVSRLSAFTFFTPIFGVIFGTLVLNEEFTVSLMVGLPMVSLGIFFVNWRRRTAS